MNGADGGPGGSNVHMIWERLGIQPTSSECLDEDPKVYVIRAQAKTSFFVIIFPCTSIVMTYAPPSHSPVLYIAWPYYSI